MPKKVKIEYEVDKDKFDILQASADARGKTVSAILEAGEDLGGIVNDQLYQALSRKIMRKEYPAELVAEAQAFAALQVAERERIANAAVVS